MAQVRKPFQGVLNIIRFNWHFYALSISFLLLFIFISNFLEGKIRLVPIIITIIIFVSTSISLFVSIYVYDLSNLYQLNWLEDSISNENNNIININAGFDETSVLLKNKFGNRDLKVFDFYDPAQHTEISIKRARNAYPSFSGTQSIKTTFIPMLDKSVDFAFVIFSAHEIRDDNERILFFKELNRIIKTNGQVIITEHLRDLSNFLAYNIGFFHFYSKANWHRTFNKAGLMVKKEIKITPFISTFILEKNGITP